MNVDRTAPRFAARLRRAVPYRRLPAGIQRWLLRSLPGRRRHGRRLSAAPRREARWLRVLAGVVVMAALFAVLLSAAEPAPAAAGRDAAAAAFDGPRR